MALHKREIAMTTSALNLKSAFELQLAGYGLTTAKLFYHLPDHPHLIQLLSGRITISRRNFRCCVIFWNSGSARSKDRCIPSATRIAACLVHRTGAMCRARSSCTERRAYSQVG